MTKNKNPNLLAYSLFRSPKKNYIMRKKSQILKVFILFRSFFTEVKVYDFLGHASQAECAYSKIHSCMLALDQDPNKNQLLNRAFLIQYFDIAGARAHKTGNIFLSDALFADYDALYHFLNRLLSSSNHDPAHTKEQYLQYLSEPIKKIIEETTMDEPNAQITRLEEIPLHFEYFFMLAWQFRILQDDSTPQYLSLLANACLTEFKPSYSLGFWKNDPTLETLQVILDEIMIFTRKNLMAYPNFKHESTTARAPHFTTT